MEYFKMKQLLPKSLNMFCGFFQYVFLFLELISIGIFSPTIKRHVNGYDFPVYSTELCPRNEAEWNKRSTAINCTEDNGYMCLPNENITELLEFCYKYPFVLIQEGICLYLDSRYSLVDSYSCSEFLYGCHNTSFPSYKLFEYPECTSIGNGCFLYEVSCKSSTSITDFRTTTEKSIFNWIVVGTTCGVLVFMCTVFLLFIYFRKEKDIQKKSNEDKQHEESLLHVAPTFLPSHSEGIVSEVTKTTDVSTVNISSPILKSLLSSFIVEIPEDPERLSFTAECLDVSKITEFVDEIRSLSRGVVLLNDLTEDKKPGTVCIFEVVVKNVQNQVVVEEKNPEKMPVFFQKENKAIVKVILIKGIFNDVSETKTKVNEKYKRYFHLGTFILLHVSEDYDNVAKVSAHQKIESFQQHVESIGRSIPLNEIESIVKNAFNRSLSKESITQSCMDAVLQDSGNTASDPYYCNSSFKINRVKKELLEKTMESIGKYLGSEIAAEMQRPIFLESENNFNLQTFFLHDLFIILKSILIQTISYALMSLFHQFMSFLGGPILRTINVNSMSWRKNVASEIYDEVSKKRDEALKNATSYLMQRCKVTTEHLKTIAEQLSDFQRRLDLINEDPK